MTGCYNHQKEMAFGGDYMGVIRRTIGENIKMVCALKGIRQIDIAEHMKVSQGSVSNWIKGVNSIDIENLAELCAFLGVSLDQIYGVAPITPDVSLSAEETDLIGLFRSMNKAGRDMLLNTARVFVGNPDMQKDDGNTATA